MDNEVRCFSRKLLIERTSLYAEIMVCLCFGHQDVLFCICETIERVDGSGYFLCPNLAK